MANRLLKIGVTGSHVAAACCFTLVLVGGVSAVGYLDIVLFPALAIFIGGTGSALWTSNRQK